MTITPPQAGRCAGTHAAAGPIPADSLGYPTPDVSAGPRPAEHRSAIPTREYEAGSGARRHHPAPAHRPHPPRPPPPRGGPLAGPEAYGAAPPASRLLRIALRATALRAGRDPGASAAPGQETRSGP